MKNHLLIIALLLASPAAFSQTTPDYVSTTVPPDSRFEIIQSNLIDRIVFKADKYTGDVYRIVFDDKAFQSWTKMTRLNHPYDSIVHPGKVNYQVFVSGFERKYTYLVNLNTGATWIAVNSRGNYLWDPVLNKNGE